MICVFTIMVTIMASSFFFPLATGDKARRDLPPLGGGTPAGMSQGRKRATPGVGAVTGGERGGAAIVAPRSGAEEVKENGRECMNRIAVATACGCVCGFGRCWIKLYMVCF